MDLFDSKRQERLEAARKASTASKEAARAFLIRAGILYLMEKLHHIWDKVMNKENLSSVALLSNDGDMTSFRYGNNNIRFRTPKCLKRYTEVKEWDKGYIVVMADYEGLGETEEYIDLLPILKNLYINPETFLKPIKSVKIDYHEGRRD